MRALNIAIIGALARIVCGCGGGSSSSGSSPAFSIQSGNWNISAVSSAGPGSNFSAGGNLSQSGSNISGILHFVGSPCLDFLTDVPVSGSVSGQKVTLTSPVITGEVVTVNASGSATALSGTYTLTASGPSCGASDQGTFTATVVPSVSGTWHGAFSSSVNPGTNINVSANITQSAAPDAHGFFPITGTLTFSGSSCFTAGTVVSGPLASNIAGSTLNLFISTNDQPSPGLTSFDATADVPATASAMTGNYLVIQGNCSLDAGTGHVTKP